MLLEYILSNNIVEDKRFRVVFLTSTKFFFFSLLLNLNLNFLEKFFKRIFIIRYYVNGKDLIYNYFIEELYLIEL